LQIGLYFQGIGKEEISGGIIVIIIPRPTISEERTCKLSLEK
jgi:hypothetical protein